MLTPAFEIRQDSRTVFLTIKAPYTNIKDCDIYVFENEVKFYSKPYFLRLNLPGNVVENGNATAKYDADSGTFELVLPKEVPGEWFEDLELLTKLLAPKVKPGQQPFIEDIDGAPTEVLDDEEGDIWQVEQIPFEEAAASLQSRMYGFNRSKTGVIARIQADLPGICDIRDPELKSVEIARAERLEREKKDFDGDHYLHDLFDNEGEIAEVLNAELDLTKELKFDDDESALLSRLPARSFIMTKEDKLRCVLGLADLMFAWAYNNRVCEGEWHTESGWTVAKLSSTLAYMEEFISMKAVMNSCIRRSLIYPLYRRYDLAVRCWQDAIEVFRAGSMRVLKCLLDIHHALENDADARYVLNELYIADYMIWLQRQCKSQRLVEIADKMAQVEVTKEELCLDLAGFEEAAKIVELEKKLESLAMEKKPSEQASVGDSKAVAAANASTHPVGAPAAVLDSDDESGSASSTSANDTDDYDSFEESNSSDAQSTSSSSTSEPQSLKSASSVNRNL
ncbi:hypothetical protein BIW11_04991 [Tropilaelaps mercedesae]|uniref:Protein SHQ1 homolog n=1 Tax=Tropilaelaps mercedesae TaxID=418985 RepID=A0A1V9WYN8_9ACAR|nr:hypothetical protein BIW11_04991 [Tropilaelaps mercedesae]